MSLFFYILLGLFHPPAIQYSRDLHKCRALAHVWLLGCAKWELVPSSDVLMRRLRLTRCCGYTSVPQNWRGLEGASSFFLVSLPETQISVIQARLLWCILFIFLFNFGLYFGTSTTSFWFIPVHRLSRHNIIISSAFLSMYKQVAWHVSFTPKLSGNNKQTNNLAKDGAETGYHSLKEPDFTHWGVSCALFDLKEKRLRVHMLHICMPSPVTYAPSCSDRIISAWEHFAPLKLIHSSSFVFMSYSCHRLRRQAVLMSNWAQLLPCFILMMHSEQRKAFFFFFF